MGTMDVRIIVIATLTGYCVAASCPDTWVSYHDSCYLFGHDVLMTFFSAEEYCKQHGGHLVHVNDATENAFLKDHIQRSASGHHYWIGLSDERVEGVWVWYDTNTRPTFTYWYHGEPNGGYVESCGQYRATKDYYWNDVKCSHLSEPICEKRQTLAVVG